MKKDHYDHVRVFFEIDDAHPWDEEFEGQVNLRSLIVIPSDLIEGRFLINDWHNGIQLFKWFSCREQAQEVVNYISRTEIMFI